jgi:hypothetical protein
MDLENNYIMSAFWFKPYPGVSKIIQCVKLHVYVKRVESNQRGNQNPYIEE